MSRKASTWHKLWNHLHGISLALCSTDSRVYRRKARRRSRVCLWPRCSRILRSSKRRKLTTTLIHQRHRHNDSYKESQYWRRRFLPTSHQLRIFKLKAGKCLSRRWRRARLSDTTSRWPRHPWAAWCLQCASRWIWPTQLVCASSVSSRVTWHLLEARLRTRELTLSVIRQVFKEEQR